MLHPELVTATEYLLIREAAAVLIENNNDFLNFLNVCEERGINPDSIERAKRIGYKNFHYNGGFQTISYGEMCLEYQIGKGFCSVSEKNAIKYVDYIITVEEFENNIFLKG